MRDCHDCLKHSYCVAYQNIDRALRPWGSPYNFLCNDIHERVRKALSFNCSLYRDKDCSICPHNIGEKCYQPDGETTKALKREVCKRFKKRLQLL